MKVAVIAAPHRRWSKYDWVAAAFEKNGHEVRRATFGDDAHRAERWAEVSVWEPKWLQNHVGTRPFGVFRVGWMFDLVAYQERPLAEQCLLFQYDGQKMEPTPLMRGLMSCDLALVKERGLLGEYRELGVNAEWFDQACPSWIGECEHRGSPRWDALVLGTTRWRRRCDDVAAVVKAGLRVGWAVQEGNYGHVQGVDYVPFVPPEQLPDLASDAAVVVDCGCRSDLDGYWSDKLWLVLGMGACHVRRLSPGLPVPSGRVKYSTYHDTETLVGRVRHFCASVEDRREMGVSARRWVMRYHTYEHRVRGLLECVQRTSGAAAAAGVA